MQARDGDGTAGATRRRELRIDKRDLRRAEMVEVEAPPLAPGSARLRLDRFGLTANNITYAAMGEGFAGYWDFFPAADGGGRVPVWGFGTVVASRAPGVEEGARCFGYYPLAESVEVVPVNVSARGFADGAAARAEKAAIYNHYADTRTDPGYDADYEAELVLFRPLYASGWWAAERAMQGRPRTVVVSSASSKTALATAHALRTMGEAEVVGLTSSRNEAYVRESGLYARTCTYDDAEALAVEGPAAYIDFLGNARIAAAVHRALAAGLAQSIAVGATDWAAMPGGPQASDEKPIGPKREFLFVPTYAAERLKADRDLGPAMLRDQRAFYERSRSLVTATQQAGDAAILDAWNRLANDRASPREGFVLSF